MKSDLERYSVENPKLENVIVNQEQELKELLSTIESMRKNGAELSATQMKIIGGVSGRMKWD